MDIRMTYDNISQAGDFVVTKGDLATDRDLETAVLISLFTDRRASDDDVVPDGTDDRRGCWMDALSEIPLGSRIWLLNREKIIPSTVAALKEYIEEALQWLLDQHIARAVTVTCTPDSRKHQITAAIDIARNGQNRRYQYVWRQINGI